MKGNYKIVVNTAAGRRRYLQYLIPFVVSNELVDRYDLWVNTTDKLDICFLEEMSKKYPKTSNPQLSSSASFLRLNVLSSLN